MIQSPEDRRFPLSPQLALRVAVLGGLALVLFGVIFFRLWYLQVLSGDQYVAQANTNQVREVRIPAPRGDVVDRNGQVLVTNRQSTVVQVQPTKLPPAGPRRRSLYRRLARVLGLSPRKLARTVREQSAALPYANVTVKTDVGDDVTAYVSERQRDFPGVTVEDAYLRRYPHGDLAAQLVGYVGQISPGELKQEHFRDVKQGTIVGQAGIEYQYDRYLRGHDGANVLQIDSLGRYKGFLRRIDPTPGSRLRLSLDLGLQRTGQQALLQAGHGLPGAFVALDPRNGQVLAMGSYPTFNPSVFVPSISQHDYKALTDKSQGAPLINRAIAGGYPTGSTFKPITALAGLASGVLNPGDLLGSGSCIQVGEAQRCNAGHADLGAQDLTGALKVSSDTYFYTVGMLLNPVRSEPLQRWAHKLGFGQPSGIDLPTDLPGNVPSPQWRARIAEAELRCERRRHISFPPGCGISDGRPWSIGDEVNLAVGQGDLLASPLQLAVAYSTLENGGTLVRPHLGIGVEDAAGRLMQSIDEPPRRRFHIPYSYRSPILDGLHLAASESGGTSADVWKGWPQGRYPIYGKTGTAQHTGQQDQSWYVCFVPDRARPIVIVVTIEQGGFGAQAAAPAARLIMSKWFGQKGQFVQGSSHTL